MFPYWFLFSFASLGALEFRRHELARRAAPFLGLIAVLIVLMLGFRYRVGADWYNYEEIFSNYRLLSLDQVFSYGEPGFAVLNWLCHRLDLNIWFVNLVCAAIFGWGLARFAKAQPNPWLALVVAIPYLVIVVGMGYTRQAVAIGFVMAGLSRVGRAPLWHFALYVALASLFHKSAVIVLPVVALSSSRNRLMTAGLLLSIAGLIYYYLVAGSVDRLMSNYIEAEYNSQGAAIRVIMNVPPALIFLIWRRRFGLPPAEESLWRNFAYSSFVALMLLFALSSSTAVDRMALYLIPLQLFVFARVPYVFAHQGTRNAQLVAAVILYYAAIQFVWLNFAEHSRFWVPYHVFPVGEEVPVAPPSEFR